MKSHEAQEQPAEHVRFAVYLNELAGVSDSDETALVEKVLRDPDLTMARSAVLRHVDRRAAELHPGPCFERWATAMAQAVVEHPFLTRRLQEWSLFRAITLGQSRPLDSLQASSPWLQLKVASASTSSAEALHVLATSGRTKRIRNTAATQLDRQRGL
jgi:hypothetical protein